MSKKKHPQKQCARRLNIPSVLIALVWGAALVALAWLGLRFDFISGSAGQTENPPLVVSEIMSANSAAWPVDGGVYPDWIELWNPSDQRISLKDWRICNTLDVRGAAALPDVTLEPDQRIVLICAPADEEQSGLFYTGFTLDADGDWLYLVNAGNEIVSQVQVPALKKDEVYAYDADMDAWAISSLYTPGAENTEEAHRVLIQPEFDPAGIYINEVMASNQSCLKDVGEETPDWVEIFNATGQNVNLSGWSLTNDACKRSKWRFPELTLAPNEYKIVFLSGLNDAGEELHTNFKLSAECGEVYLVNAQGELVSYIEYKDLETDVSLSRQADGGLTTRLTPTPGFENTERGAELCLGTQYRMLQTNEHGLYLNEIMCSMQRYPDWAELYNASSEAINLGGWWLSDDPEHPRSWEFPSGTCIPAGGYLLVFLSGEAEAPENSLSADFSLSLSGGETLTLARSDGTIVDCVELHDQMRNLSYGRAAGYEQYRYFSQYTPGKANAAQSYAQCASPVVFSVSGGYMQSDSIALELSADEGMSIYYTLDGSTPNLHSNVYAGPIQLDRNCVVKAVAWKADARQSDLVTNTYIFGVSGTLRLVSITGERSDLNGSNGVLNTGYKQSKDVNIEIYDYDGTKLISQGCELTTSGRNSRTTQGQKAFRVVAKSAYGDGKFRAKLFAKRDYTGYNALVFRASGQDSEQTHMRDSILTSLADQTEVYYQETELTAVYVNGEYWGMYNMRERVDASSICQFEGWEGMEDTIDIVEGKEAAAVQGSSESYHEMMRFVSRNSLASAEKLAELRKYCDVENYLDYAALQIYCCNEDLANLRAYRNPNGDGLWRWAIYDLDLSYQIDKNSFSGWLSSSGEVGSVSQQSNVLFDKLMDNAEMRDYFLRRFGELLSTSFSSENVLLRIENRYNAIEAEMERNCERWNWSISSWKRYGTHLVSYAKKRPKALIVYAQKSFKLTDAQVQDYFGAAIAQIQSASNG